MARRPRDSLDLPTSLITIIGGSGFLGRHIVQAPRQARLSHPGRLPQARPRRPRAAARHSRPDHAGAGQCALSGLAGGGLRRRLCGDQPDRHPLRLRRPELRCHPCLRRRGLGQGGARRPRRRLFIQMSAIGADAAARPATMPVPRPRARCGPAPPFPAPSSSGPRSSSDPRTASSTGSPPWPVSAPALPLDRRRHHEIPAGLRRRHRRSGGPSHRCRRGRRPRPMNSAGRRS